ncbi:MAG: bifunctional hydroxymethylpyrimidine kinase/phosphomethylpyrimidine kinase [Rhizobiales bacterium]|nr:bifunctional hydroxymethylpyrimidine kinase/phosphomethylpyrimidine kinase [Hyphomicrobiales bacterium]NRB14635.1 bifunctional hydroxymethylpyrimidine kinase/phosphomethylpyrimidine kinase [Hyphomicrobiales bacterium]
MAVILAISSQVAYGRVGLSAYSFALQKLGHELIALPTVNWLTHPKLAGQNSGKPIGEVTDADKLADMGAALISLRLEEKIDWVMSGYFVNAAQAHSVKWLVTQLKSKNPDIKYCCDPVMGDVPNGLYVAEDVAQYIKNSLAPLADLLTPNQFEADYLDSFRNKQILYKTATANIFSDNGNEISQAFTPVDVHMNGAGDLLAALFIGYQLNGVSAPKALEKATEFLQLCAQYWRQHDCQQLPVIELQDYL